MTTQIKYWVTSTDRFMSGWGLARDKINKLVFECETYEEAIIVYNNANSRTDQKNVNICSTKPHYNSNSYFVQIKDKKECPQWYVKDYFKR